MPVSIPVTVTNRLTLASGDPDRTTLPAVPAGAYDRTERRFLGFREAVRTVPGATAATTVRTVTRFHPGLGADRALRGEVLYEAVEDGNGVIFRETENDVTAMAVTG